MSVSSLVPTGSHRAVRSLPRVSALALSLGVLPSCSSHGSHHAGQADAATRDADAPDADDDALGSMQDAVPDSDGVIADTALLPQDVAVEAEAPLCPPGIWTDVTPATLAPSDLRPSQGAYGPGSIVGDPARPSDLYVGGSSSGLWKSSDYGDTWTQINTDLPYAPRGVTIAVAGTTPATIWAAGNNTIYKSTDGGATFTPTGAFLTQSLYSLKVDPYDPNHLVSGLNEADGLLESTDAGNTWHPVGGTGWPSGGVSWYPYFIETGDAASTGHTWLAISQSGGGAVMTSDGGANWNVPNGLKGLQHPHGNSQIFQSGAALFVAGIGGPGQGVYRSTDLGLNWSRVDEGNVPEAVVWGTPKCIYAMYALACSGCNLGTNFETAPQPGVTWSQGAVPSSLLIGPNSVVVTNDGSHSIFVAVMWDQGIWRSVEP